MSIRRRTSVTRAVMAAVLVGGAASLAPVAPAGAATTVLGTFATPGAATFVVPALVCAVTITVDGGHGGAGFDNSAPGPGGAGGAGAHISARFAMSSGTTLTLFVGGGGANATSTVPGMGGVGGGGGGGFGANTGGGGGGATTVATSTPILVASGGGGGGGSSTTGGGGIGVPRTQRSEGAGPATSGDAGGRGGTATDGGGGGGGIGGASSGGARPKLGAGGGPGGAFGGAGGAGNGVFGGGGGGGGKTSDLGTSGTGTGTGASGVSTTGGAGGAGASTGGNGGTAGSGGGGGGGGRGFSGGGGGGSAAGGGGGGYGAGAGGATDMGGGGGSRWGAPSAMNMAWAASARSGGGQVVISYDPITDVCPVVAPVGHVPPIVYQGPNTRPLVALSIDDLWGAANALNVNAVMDILAAKHVKGITFFPTGGALEQHHAEGYDWIWQRVARSNSEIGNHTYTHTALTSLNNSQIRYELQHTQDLLNIDLGVGFRYQMHLMRPPGGNGGYGGGDPRILPVVNSMGLSMIMWSIETHGSGPVHRAYVSWILSHAHPGSIVLMHFSQITPSEIAAVIDGLRSRGLEPTTVTSLFP
jgi:peptidoglycan/xylan/chitin deacetylase (PgdA/CDA1 family)